MSKRPIKIAIVDNPEVLELLKEKLGDQFEDIIIMDFDDPEEAARAIEAEDHIDALVTDLKMPGLNGKELAKKVHEKKSNVPVYMRTGFSDEVTEEDKEDAGINDVLSKLDEDSLLMDLIESLKTTDV